MARERLGKEEFFVRLVSMAGEMSACLKRRVGAALVRDRMVLSLGYNGPPRGVAACEVCYNEALDKAHCVGVHAEQNAIVQCAIKQTDPRGSTLYCSRFPCASCAKLVIQAGVADVVVVEDRDDAVAKSLLRESGIPWRVVGGKAHGGAE